MNNQYHQKIQDLLHSQFEFMPLKYTINWQGQGNRTEFYSVNIEGDFHLKGFRGYLFFSVNKTTIRLRITKTKWVTINPNSGSIKYFWRTLFVE